MGGHRKRARIRLEKEPQGRLRWLTQEEITRLLDAAAKSRNRELRAAVIDALNTGLRLGELLGLTWERADLWSAPHFSAHREELSVSCSARYSAGLRIPSAECGARVL